MRIAVIGGGAAGCFAAINIMRGIPNARVMVYEGGKKLLAKVAITGGGRCNLTNSFNRVRSIDAVYPRGARLMKRLLKEFSNSDTCKWFEDAGVKLVTQEDQCVFPKSQDAMEIVHTLTREMYDCDVEIKTGHRVCRINYCAEDNLESTDNEAESCGGRFNILFNDKETAVADFVVVTTGGSPKLNGLNFIDGLGLEIVEPVPSLFSFCLPNNGIKELMGTVVENVSVGIAGTKFKADGAILITHWGVSGPAILKLSSYAARYLSENSYKAQLSINWLGDMNENGAAKLINDIAAENPQKLLQNAHPAMLNNRLWNFLLNQSGIRPDIRWTELGRKGHNKLVAMLTSNLYNIDGKNKYKDEFVTCGGISLSNVQSSTLECRNISGLYFAGEVLDVDAITGGFNLQAAWTMGYTVAKAIVTRCSK